MRLQWQPQARYKPRTRTETISPPITLLCLLSFKYSSFHTNNKTPPLGLPLAMPGNLLLTRLLKAQTQMNHCIHHRKWGTEIQPSHFPFVSQRSQFSKWMNRLPLRTQEGQRVLNQRNCFWNLLSKSGSIHLKLWSVWGLWRPSVPWSVFTKWEYLGSQGIKMLSSQRA